MILPKAPPISHPSRSALSLRLCSVAELAEADVQLLEAAAQEHRRTPARRELIAPGDVVRARHALVSGWACRQRTLLDGRRQILTVLLPGDLIGAIHRPHVSATTSVMAVTDVTTCCVPDAEPGSALADAYASCASMEEQGLLSHIVRLGQLNAYERLADWMLETHERLEIVGLARGGAFAMPLTQEMLGDTLGLTGVHVNRTIQSLRRDGLLSWQNGYMTIVDHDRMAAIVNYQPLRTRLSPDVP